MIGNLGERIFEFLELGDMLETGLSRSVIEFLTKTKGIQEISFEDFVNWRLSGNGLRMKDEPYSEEAIARIAAARIGKWLNGMVLQGQDILVDAPHLVSRLPSLVSSGLEKVEDWNRVASFEQADELGLDPVIKSYRFKHEDWLTRPAWYWRGVSNDMEINEVADPWTMEKPRWVFCEDISKYIPLKEAKRFIADLESPFVHRFVKEVEGITYIPKVRFSF